MFKASREIIVDESDIVKILAVIGNHLGYFDGQIGNCRWSEGLAARKSLRKSLPILMRSENLSWKYTIRRASMIGVSIVARRRRKNIKKKGQLIWMLTRKLKSSVLS